MIRSEEMDIAEWAEAISGIEFTDIQKELLKKVYAHFRYNAKDGAFSELVDKFNGIEKRDNQCMS